MATMMQPNIFTSWVNDNSTFTAQSIEPIQGDASLRHFYRIQTATQSLIFMDSSNDPSLPQFIKLSNLLDDHGVPVPHVYAFDSQKGYALLSDLGSQRFFDVIHQDTADVSYKKALVALAKLHHTPKQAATELPKMEEEFFNTQMGLFQTWYLNKYLQCDASMNCVGPLLALFEKTFHALPQVFTHLDYHSKNLMIAPDGEIGILDFQDARQGPCTYDLVSLLQDAYVYWPRHAVLKWIETYFKNNETLCGSQDFQTFVKSFDITGIQRHLKNLGIFARLSIRDQKPQYLQFIPVLIKHILDACHLYPELNDLAVFFKQYVLSNAFKEELTASSELKTFEIA